jgi:hypothetical protein
MSKHTRVNRRVFLGSAAAVGATVCAGSAMAEPKGQEKFQANTVEEFLKNRQSLATDPYRPLYHFSPPGFGTHDPAGLCRESMAAYNLAAVNESRRRAASPSYGLKSLNLLLLTP